MRSRGRRETRVYTGSFVNFNDADPPLDDDGRFAKARARHGVTSSVLTTLSFERYVAESVVLGAVTLLARARRERR